MRATGAETWQAHECRGRCNALLKRLRQRRHASRQRGIGLQLQQTPANRQRYRSGRVDFQTVLSTQRTQLSTQDSVASASADVSADPVRLFKALGGGWRADVDGARTAPTP